MKKLSLILCTVAILCLINVTNIRADGTVNQTNSVSTPPPPPVEQQEKTTTLFENFDQKANQLFNLLSTVMKSMKEMKQGVTRNIN